MENLRNNIETEVLKIDPNQFTIADLEKPAKVLREGGVVAVPTDTIYGILIAEKNSESGELLNQLKGREKDRPLITFLSKRENIFQFVNQLPILAERLTHRYWPGPLTVIVEDNTSQQRSFRVPGVALARELVDLIEEPILSTSANVTGGSEANTAEEVAERLSGNIELVLDGGTCPLKLASTVVAIDKDHYQLLREGDVTREMIEKERNHKTVFICTGNICRSPMAMAIMQHVLAEKYNLPSFKVLGKAGFQIESAGLMVSKEQPINHKARKALEELGYSVSEHRSQKVSWKQLKEAKNVFVLTKTHRDELVSQWPEFREKIQMLAPKDIEDPYGSTQQNYLKCAKEIEVYVKQLVEKLCE